MTTDRGHVTRLSIPLRYRDMDEFGHLNQSIYHVFLEEARAAIVVEVLGTEDVGYVLARVELDYRHEVRRTDGEVVVEAWIEAVGTSSLRLGTRVLLTDGTVAAAGTTVLVGWDPEARAARRIGDEERALLVGAQGATA